FGEALRPEFKAYQEQVVRNASHLAQKLVEHGLRIVSGGTDNHLMMVDVRPANLTGKEAEAVLGKVHITANKNMIPFDPAKPNVTSGIRFGSPAVTSRGMREAETEHIAAWIAQALYEAGDQGVLAEIR